MARRPRVSRARVRGRPRGGAETITLRGGAYGVAAVVALTLMLAVAAAAIALAVSALSATLSA
jgi:hypothetical protein